VLALGGLLLSTGRAEGSAFRQWLPALDAFHTFTLSVRFIGRLIFYFICEQLFNYPKACR
jgi:hypothetical protein